MWRGRWNRIARVVGALFVAIADINARSPPVPFFDKTRTSLRSWLAAVWYITNQKQGVTAFGLQRVLGLGSYQTAWTMLHRLRRAMIRPGRERLSGVVEVDECFVGHTPRQQKPVKKKGKKTVKQQDSGNTVIAVAVEIKLTKGFGRIRLSRNRCTLAGRLDALHKRLNRTGFDCAYRRFRRPIVCCQKMAIVE